MSNAVREFCFKESCLNLYLDNYFAQIETGGNRMPRLEWCCNNCDQEGGRGEGERGEREEGGGMAADTI